jgi:Skp family chaperone for outer membrane proteins
LNNRLSKVLIFSIVIAFAAVCGTFYFFKGQHSVEAKSVRIAVIDSTRIKNQSIPFVRMRQLLEEQHAAAHKEILDQETQIRQQYESFKKSKDSLAEKQKEKLELDKKGSELGQIVHKKQEELTKQFSLLTEKLEAEFYRVIQEIVKEYGFNLVLNSTIQETQAILYADAAFDITDEVIKRLDKKLPNIALPVS